MIVDATTDVLAAALRGLGARQRASADNIANVETPGYTATRVSFEDALRHAASQGRARGLDPTTGRSTDPAGLNGNNVRIDDEMVLLVENGLSYQLMVAAVNNKFDAVRSAIGR